MTAQGAYIEAWTAIEPPLRKWLKRQDSEMFALEQVFLFADIQAILADILRDRGVNERSVLRTLEAFRMSLRSAGRLDTDTLLYQARKAVAKEALYAMTAEGDIEQEALREVAQADITGAWKWKARLDSRTCLFCLSMHGRTFITPFRSHPNCRCMPVNETVTLADGWAWLNRRAAPTLRRMVGPTRAVLIQKGATPDVMVDFARMRPRNLRELPGGGKHGRPTR